MVRILAGAAVAVIVAACATTPPTPAEQVVGKWACKTESEGVTVNGTVDYAAGGKGLADVVITVNQGMAMEIKATAESSWSFNADGKMEETITKATVTAGKAGGDDVPPAMIQPMIEQMVVNQTTTSTVQVSQSAMTLVDGDGVTTNCTR